jgi:hypothetical protein
VSEMSGRERVFGATDASSSIESRTGLDLELERALLSVYLFAWMLLWWL